LRNKYGKNLQTFASDTVTVANVLPHVIVERKHLATLAGNAARQNANILPRWQVTRRVTADGGKPRSFILRQKKHE